MLSQSADIFSQVLLPVLLVVGFGALLQRVIPLDVASLSKLSIYLLVPSLMFVKVYQSTLGWAQIGGVAAAVLLPMVVIGLPLYVVLRRRRCAGTTIAAVLIGGLIMNAGNFGLPVAALTYGLDGQGSGLRFPGMASADDGLAVQALVVMMSSLSIWGLGYMLIALAKGDGLRGAVGFFRLPVIYAIVAAFVLRDTGTTLPAWFFSPIEMIGESAIAIMLIILGAQLAKRPRWPRWRAVTPVVLVKLGVMPAVTAAVVYSLGLWPWPGAQVVIGMAAPTAVNTLVLTLELEGDADLAADCVFWSTAVSVVTVTAVIAVLSTFAAA